MRKSWWAIAAGLGTLALLTGCGSSPASTSAASPPSSSAAQSTLSTPSTQSPTTSSPSSAATTPANSASSKATGSATYPAAGSSSASHSVQTAPQPQPSGNLGSIPPVGTTVMIVEHTSIGYVLAEASGQVVYTYGNDKKYGAPTCTGACAAVWLPVTGVPQAGPADTFPGKFGLVTRTDGKKQITYNGYPLYTLKGASYLSTKGNGVDGLWHVVMLSASDITA
jgi:predicted lipoprotein with Yx(FWY)xxD motif